MEDQKLEQPQMKVSLLEVLGKKTVELEAAQAQLQMCNQQLRELQKELAKYKKESETDVHNQPNR